MWPPSAELELWGSIIYIISFITLPSHHPQISSQSRLRQVLSLSFWSVSMPRLASTPTCLLIQGIKTRDKGGQPWLDQCSPWELDLHRITSGLYTSFLPFGLSESTAKLKKNQFQIPIIQYNDSTLHGPTLMVLFLHSSRTSTAPSQLSHTIHPNIHLIIKSAKKQDPPLPNSR